MYYELSEIKITTWR